MLWIYIEISLGIYFSVFDLDLKKKYLKEKKFKDKINVKCCVIVLCG